MKTMRYLFGMMTLVVFSMTARAQQNDQPVQNNPATPEVVVSLNDSYTGGKVEVLKKEGQLVIITVTPNEDYYIRKGDLEVLPVKDPASATRADEAATSVPTGSALTLTLVDKDGNPVVDAQNAPLSDAADLTQARNYQFTVPEGLGAWISKAAFQKIAKEGKLGDVTWSITSETSKSAQKVTLTLDGSGTATVKDGEQAPWVMQQTQITHVVVGADIAALDAGLLEGCTALTSVAIQNDADIVTLGANAIPANEKLEVEVPGNLFNEYETTEGWKAFTLTTKGIEMEGVAFEKNSYDTFVSTGKAVKIPSVLNAFVITAIKDNSVVIEEVKDGIIPTDVPVLLLSKALKSKDLKSGKFYTAATDDKGGSYKSILEVAVEKKEVKLGEVYLLYNDVFYLSQKGTIPAGGIYLPKPVSKTRSALVIGGENDGTTGIIDAARLIDNGLSGSWYDLSGRKFNGKPTTKGIYIIDGKKVVIK